MYGIENERQLVKLLSVRNSYKKYSYKTLYGHWLRNLHHIVHPSFIGRQMWQVAYYTQESAKPYAYIYGCYMNWHWEGEVFPTGQRDCFLLNICYQWSDMSTHRPLVSVFLYPPTTFKFSLSLIRVLLCRWHSDRHSKNAFENYPIIINTLESFRGGTGKATTKREESQESDVRGNRYSLLLN